MSQDVVYQMGTMLAHAIHSAMAIVAALSGVLLVVETLGRLQSREMEPVGNTHPGSGFALPAALPPIR